MHEITDAYSRILQVRHDTHTQDALANERLINIDQLNMLIEFVSNTKNWRSIQIVNCKFVCKLRRSPSTILVLQQCNRFSLQIATFNSSGFSKSAIYGK